MSKEQERLNGVAQEGELITGSLGPIGGGDESQSDASRALDAAIGPNEERADAIDEALGLDPGTSAGVSETLRQLISAGELDNGEDQGDGGNGSDGPDRLNGVLGAGLSGRERQVASLLDSIGSQEAPEGYGQIYGGAKGVPKDTDVSVLTLDEVDALQSKMKASGSKSTASGRYQFLQKTLREVRQEMGLTGKEVWNSKLQDKMAVVLLERRGLSKYLSGKMSREKFALGLAQEWASLPVPSDMAGHKGRPVKAGQSFYAGDGLNKSFHSVESIMAQVDSLAGGPTFASKVPPIPSGKAADVYVNIPANEKARFLEWNSDPIGNEEANLASVDPNFKPLIERVRELSGVNVVVASGKRSPELQKKAVAWGWSQTEDSDHLTGEAVDLWPLDEKGQVKFDKGLQAKLGPAIKQAMAELGLEGEWGGDWKSFKDLPHIALKPGQVAQLNKKSSTKKA